MKNNEWSETTSNFLVISSVLLALTPFLLGDQLVVIVTRAMKESGVMVDQFSAFLLGLFS
jgi:hypothetical protein